MQTPLSSTEMGEAKATLLESLMNLNEFKQLFLNEMKALLRPILGGHQHLVDRGLIEDSTEFDPFDSVANGFRFLAMRCLLQDGEISEREIDLFVEVFDFLNISGNIKKYEREVHRSVMQSMYKAFVAEGTLEEPFVPPMVHFTISYDLVNGTNFADRARHLVYSFAMLCMQADGKIEQRERIYLSRMKDALWKDYGNAEGEPSDLHVNVAPTRPAASAVNNAFKDDEQVDVDATIAELNAMIGINSVKEEVQRLVNAIKVNKMREEKGLPVASTTNHLVFYGNPGTGKTTVARLLARIFKGLGVLTRGHLIEVDRSGLVAGYVGQTSLKSREVIQTALGGVLFIDEAYTLAKEGNDYGTEAIETLLKMMEDHRKDLIVIVAGYTDKMGLFLSTNPGLKSRFTRFMNFPDYGPHELTQIFDKMAEGTGILIAPDAKHKALQLFEAAYADRTDAFGNGRLVRNLLHDAMSHQADRIVMMDDLDERTLQTLEASDIPEMFATI
jgi:Holliday junction resolvasome RuvABC ATP-dependent DNA helicase subunit